LIGIIAATYEDAYELARRQFLRTTGWVFICAYKQALALDIDSFIVDQSSWDSERCKDIIHQLRAEGFTVDSGE
jgi:hypothetical protein